MPVASDETTLARSRVLDDLRADFDTLLYRVNVSFTFKDAKVCDQKETWSHIKDIVFGGLFLVSELEQIRRHTL